MRIIAFIAEWFLYAFMVLGGLNTILGATLYHQPIDPVLLVVFGIMFICGGAMGAIGKSISHRDMRQFSLVVIFFSLMFGFFLEVLTAPGDWAIWVDSGVLWLLAGVLRIKVYMEARNDKVQ